jgi:hypothetical protein
MRRIFCIINISILVVFGYNFLGTEGFDYENKLDSDGGELIETIEIGRSLASQTPRSKSTQ